MGIFKKIFGSTANKALAGDEQLVPVYLESIALGADPKVQVQKIRDIVGDSDDTFKEYLGELEMAGDEKPEVVKKAVDIVSAYYKEHLAGDEKSKGSDDATDLPPKAGDEKTVTVKKDDKDGKEEKNVEVKKDGKETKDIEVKKDGDKKDVVVKEAGDQKACGDAIDYDLLADKVVARMTAMNQKTAGDEGDAGVPDNSMIMNGDSAGDSVKGSDDVMKDIWG